MWICLLVVCFCSSLVVCGDRLSPVSYNVRTPSNFNAVFSDMRKVKYSLLDSEYPKQNISNGYMSGGQGKLTDGLVGQTLLLHADMTAQSNSWVAWVFAGNDKVRELNTYFQFDEEVLIESILVNVLSQKLTDKVSMYAFSTAIFQPLKADNTTTVGKGPVSETTHLPKQIGIRNVTLRVRSCHPAQIANIDFKAESRRLVLGEVQFEGEPAIQINFQSVHPKPGTQLVLSCVSNKANITIFRDGEDVGCRVTLAPGNQYSCTVTKERFGFNDSVKYKCVVYPFNTRCSNYPQFQEFRIIPSPGIYADVLELSVGVGAVANLTCHSWNVIAKIGFQKTDGGTTVDITNSTSHMLLSNMAHMFSRTTLIFFNVAMTDSGVYRCTSSDDRNVYVSQNMTLSVSNGSTTEPFTVHTSDHGSVSTTVSEVSSSTLPPTSHYTPMSVVPSVGSSDGAGGGSDGGLGGGVIGGIVFAFLFIVLVVVAVILYAIWRSRRPERQHMVEGVRYDKTVPETEPAYDTPEDLIQYPESPYIVQPDAAQGCTQNGDSAMPPQVSAHRFAQQQVNQSPDYAEADEVVQSRSKAKTFSSVQVNSSEMTESMRNRQASMPPKLGVSKLITCQKVNNSTVYSEPDLDKKSKSKRSAREHYAQSRSSHDSGLGHDNDSSPTHLYDSVGQQAMDEDAALQHREVADLAIYASLDEIQRHSQILSRQHDMKHNEDLSPEFILSFTDGSPLSPNTVASVLPYGSVYADPAPLLQEEGPLEMAQDKFSQHRRIGQGQFGDVFHAFARSVLVEDVIDGRLNGLCVKDMPVALKCLREGASKDMEEAFNKEVKFMAPLRHQHVVRLLGVCSVVEPRFMVIEYMENGDLHQYLQQFELDEQSLSEGQQLISYSVLVSMSADIAAGMEYLASKFFIHRDLATRNCLVGQNHMVKIADFGMTRSVYEKNYYRLAGRAILPIRWMAPESFYGKFTMMSDIWAFGVTCWEIFILARMQPYEELEDKDVIENAVSRDGRQLLERPACCDDPTFQLMMACWCEIAEQRPSFTVICRRLRSLAEEYKG